ncbi:MAG: DUF2442 domain-containing protein [Synergistaceae bacterium]|nr:DUF2442 domain-containing protein [Synergistaceae bacterium]
MCDKNPAWVVEEVQPHKDYTLTIKFHDGSTKLYDAKPLLKIPLYEPLKNPGFFMRAYADGTVVWNEDIDIAPEHLYEAGRPI